MRASYFFILLLGLSACSSSIDDVNLLNLKTEFEVMLTQSLSTEGSKPVLKVSTINDLDCSNSDINIQELEIGNRNTYTIMGIEMEAECNNIQAPISKYLSIHKTQDEIQIAINISSIAENDGRISNKEDRFILEMDTYDGINVVGTSVLKIHSPLIWGSYHSNNSEQFLNFQDQLSNHLAISSLHNGNYGLFRMVNGIIQLDDKIDENHVPFYIETALPIEDLLSIIKEIENRSGQSFDIQFTNHLGQHH